MLKTLLVVALVACACVYTTSTTECGGVLTDPFGVITSPNYPEDYDHNDDCAWVINAPEGNRINVNFTDFAIELHLNCGYDYLQLFDGPYASSPSIGKFCGTDLPGEFKSQSNSVRIVFFTDNSMSARGFRMIYTFSTQECGGVLTDTFGAITSPNYPQNYDHNDACAWVINAPEGTRMNVNFTDFAMELHPNCGYDYLELFDGPYASSPSIGKFCGTDPPRGFKSQSNFVRIVFFTDNSMSARGFRMTYSQECGDVITTSPGTITSPGYGSGNYSNNLDCQWVLRNEQSAENTSIVIRLMDLHLERHTHCQYDYLEAREGDSIDGVLLDQYCGNDSQIHGPIISPMPAVWLRFKTDSSIVDEGFVLTYKFTQCGGVLTNPFGVITSPNYPQDYDHNDACAWVINAPEGTRINVNFTDFAMELHPNCGYDYLELFDGPYASSPSIGKFCGTDPPSGFKSKSNSVRIVFFTDDSMSARGFRMTYSLCKKNDGNTGKGCKRRYRGSSGQIFSPGWPGRYSMNMNCSFNLRAPAGTTVSLYFNAFQVEPLDRCEYDYLEILNSTSTSVYRKLCGWVLPDPVFVPSNIVRFNFVTDCSVTYPGYHITYTASTQGLGCGGKLTGINGSFTSPGYPGNYSDASTCTWLVRVAARRVINLTFTDMRMLDVVNCATDYVIVYDGNSETANQFGRFCGDEVPAAMTARSNVALVKFVSGGRGPAIAFRATFTS